MSIEIVNNEVAQCSLFLVLLRCSVFLVNGAVKKTSLWQCTGAKGIGYS